MTGKYKRLSPTVVLNETKFEWALLGRFSNSFNSNDLINAMYVSVCDKVSDIKKAFSQIGLAEDDRDLTRFLWVDQLPNDQDNSMKLEILRMTRVVFGVTSSPFLLGQLLHWFCNASENAFGSVIFLRFTKDKKVKTAFVTSKSLLAPIKRMTLPRLKLMGAVVGARLINRVLGRDNPPDRLTRGVTIKDLENDELWWFGSSWLFKDYESVPHGGECFYERLVKCVKDPLRKISESALLTFEEVLTILQKIEAVRNMRPLTYTTNDLRETEPLTPDQFLHLERLNTAIHYTLLIL
ncbi:DUF5641 domain-containing protein [Caerostris extrusa]|uniref:DUF5641 domain-containing protein n=1 Tax=Caerostris extrusa TaxID=172846 RepID=A0AAV4NDI7_CAEEX|nr:DUF5641 domain-containing protein [Caerostris extrusa]